jgi:hypothetical protein
MPKFEDLIAEMEEAGVDPAFIDKTRATFEASPLRQELKQAKEQAQAAIDRANKAENVALTGTFKELGIKAKPTAFALPDDLDRTDRDAVQAWAVEQGLVDPPAPDVPNDQLDALDRVAAASTGAGAVSADPLAKVIDANSEAEFWAQAEANGLTA